MNNYPILHYLKDIQEDLCSLLSKFFLTSQSF